MKKILICSHSELNYNSNGIIPYLNVAEKIEIEETLKSIGIEPTWFHQDIDKDYIHVTCESCEEEWDEFYCGIGERIIKD